jgi:hypothetical protein
VVHCELVEFGYKLLQLAEDEERSVLGPCRARCAVARLAGQNFARRKKRLSGEGREIALDSRLRDTIEEAEVCSKKISA